MEKKVLEFAAQHGYCDAIKEQDWRGYQVFSPIYSREEGLACVGLPLIILVKDGKIRMSTEEEAFAYLDETDDVA